MKLFGDVPEEHRALAENLIKQERVFDMAFDIPREKLAKGYVCLAHDWYYIGADDEGLRLLNKAEQMYPGYFKVMITAHCYEDADYEYVVRRLNAELIYMLLSKLEDLKT